MQTSSNLLHQLIALARRDAPNETCGIIGGKDQRALKIYPLKNTHATPRVNFYAAPLELLAAFRDIEANDWEHLAIYHSHCATEAYPSETDIARAYYPDAMHLIVSFAHPEQIVVRGFRIIEGKIIEITVEVNDDETSRTHQRRVARRTGGSRAGRAVAAFSRRRHARGQTRRARRRVPEKI
ncbi:MAG: M67 family metallopeptidase [Anaerolineales bacterium]|nr:M67 family metallopeptidase [Anaerolineales bacterium]